MNWQEFLDKARSNLRVAERALMDGEPDPSVSRAYYAVFHAAIAALLKLTDYRPKEQTWNHESVAAEFNRRLIRQRIMIARIFRIDGFRMQKKEIRLFWRSVL